MINHKYTDVTENRITEELRPKLFEEVVVCDMEFQERK